MRLTALCSAVVLALAAGAAPLQAQVLLPPIGDFHSTGNVSATAYEGDGALLVGGLFDRAGGQPRNNLARYAANGALDPQFAPNPNGHVIQLNVDSMGRRYVAGRFSTISGQPRRGLARFSAGPTPVLDETFVPELPAASGGVEAVAFHPDGTIYASWCPADGTFQCGIVKLASNGARLPGFTVSINGQAFPMELSADGSALFFSGLANQINGQPLPATRGGLAKLDAATGAFDAAFAPFTTGSGRIRAIVQDGASHLVVGGQVPGSGDGLARIDLANGSADLGFGPDFGPGTSVIVHDVRRIPGGDLFVVGDFGTVDGAARTSHVARLAPDGTPIANWGAGAPTGGTTSGTSAVALDGSVALVRIASPLFEETSVVELAPADGAATASPIGAGFSQRGAFTRLAHQPGTGRVLAAGSTVREVDGRLSAAVVALQADLTPDVAWTSGLQTQVGLSGNLAMTAGASSVFLGGFGFAADGSRTRAFHRLDGTNGAATAWVPGATLSVGVANDVPSSMAVDEAGGYVYTANLNNNANGQALPGRPFVRFALADGVADATWTPTIVGNVSNSAMAFDDGYVYFGGFTTATASDNSTVNTLARFDVVDNGRADPTFKPFAAASSVRALAVGAEHVYAGGAGMLVRIDKLTGVIDPDWAPLTGAFGTITQLALEADGGVIATGTIAAGCAGANLSVLRIQPSGAVDPHWRLETDLPVQTALGVDAGRVLVGGAFRTIEGEARDGLAAVGPSATIFADSAGDPLCVD